MPIRKLPDALANQIAAGEVVERPASVIKELTENALDAGATHLRVDVADAGLTRIVVTDNGSGIPAEELPLALTRHATSKIARTEDLFAIHTFGFRGEALPSIASVARFTLTSRAVGAPEAWCVTPDGELMPAAHPQGTRAEVADLFYATPARRKFLKSERAERTATEVVIKNLALAHPHVTLTVVEDGVETWHIPAAQGDFLHAIHPRLAAVLGEEFARQALPIHAERPETGARLEGYISPAQLHSGTSAKQFLFVNGRPIKDRSLQAALKNAYTDGLPSGRHPMAVLFLTLPPEEVDVNVHPAKSEVRFRHASDLFGLIYAAVRQALAQHHTPAALTAAFTPVTTPTAQENLTAYTSTPSYTPAFTNLPTPPEKLWKGEAPTIPMNQRTPPPSPHTLGAALGQIASTYIVAENAEGNLTLVDQHAAHERIVYEKLKAQFAAGTVPAQSLLIPTLVTLTPAAVANLMAHAEDLARLGLHLSAHSPTTIAVTAVPQLLGSTNPAPLVAEVAEDLTTTATRTTLTHKLEHVLATLACHHSIRAGRRLSLPEQNHLLRQIEGTPGALTCNHGRPTVVTITLPELEKLFARR